MRDLMALAAMVFLIPLSLRSTFSAYLLWGWGGLIALQSYLFGFMQKVPYVQFFAIITLALFLLGRDKEKISYPFNGAAILLGMFAVHCIVAATFAFPWLARNWELCNNVLKTILFCLLMPLIITKRYRFHALMVIIVIGISFHGLIEGLKFLASGGGHRALGIQKWGDNNHMAMILVMVIPMIIYLFQYSKYRFMQTVYLVVFVVTCLAILATGSRGALLTLLAVGVWLVVLSRRKLLFITIATVVSVVIITFAPDSWTERMSTIQSADQDSSFIGRVIAWKRASAIALEHPAIGGGFHAGQDPQLFLEFNGKQGLLGFVDTPSGHYPAASHSIYFEVMGDLGFLGLILFVVLMFWPFWVRIQIKTLASSIGQEANWARDCADLLAASMVAFLVGGAALSAAYFELPYVLVMLMQVLLLVLKQTEEKHSGRHVAASRGQ